MASCRLPNGRAKDEQGNSFCFGPLQFLGGDILFKLLRAFSLTMKYLVDLLELLTIEVLEGAGQVSKHRNIEGDVRETKVGGVKETCRFIPIFILHDIGVDYSSLYSIN